MDVLLDVLHLVVNELGCWLKSSLDLGRQKLQQLFSRKSSGL